MDWFAVYKGKASRGSLTENLQKVGITYCIPTQVIQHLEGNEMVEHEEKILTNLIFIQTDQDIATIAATVDGLKRPYIDHATEKPAVISDAEMQRFIRFLEFKNMDAKILQDPYQRFKVCQKVRVKAGDFEGTEGYVFRIRGDRKLVISLGEMAVAISGIHHTLLEPID